MVDVARLAGVSTATVSRVLNDPSQASAERRDRVLRAIEELGYRPDGAARALVSGRRSIVAVLTSETSIYGYASTVRGIELAARASGFVVVISVIESAEPADVERLVDTIMGQPVAGVIALAFDPEGVAAKAAVPKDVPLVAVSGELDETMSQARIDETTGGEQITRHLLDLGHRTVVHVSVPTPGGEDGRTIGWRTALQKAGAEVPPIIEGNWSADSGVKIGRSLAERPDITAVFCGNDELAMGVIAGLADAGKRVPDDISVVGFDDHPLARIWRPAITTVAQDFGGLGWRAFGLLEAQLGGDASVRHSLESPLLRVRSSSGPAPARTTTD